MFQALRSHEKQIAKFLIAAALATFLFGLAAFGFNHYFPNILADRFVPDSLLATVTPGIVMLLLYELYILVMSTRGSFIGFIHAQFEVISLIILRDLFKKLDELSSAATPQLLREITVVSVGSIILYFFIEILERIRHNIIFAAYEEKQIQVKPWVQNTKRSLRVILATYFFGLVIFEGVRYLMGVHGSGFSTDFLSLVFGGLIIYNVLMLFVVLLVSSSYETLFEHSALVLASSVVLVALEKTPVIAVPLITGALMFVIATLLLHGYARGDSLKSLLKVAAKPTPRAKKD